MGAFWDPTFQGPLARPTQGPWPGSLPTLATPAPLSAVAETRVTDSGPDVPLLPRFTQLFSRGGEARDKTPWLGALGFSGGWAAVLSGPKEASSHHLGRGFKGVWA